MKNLPLALLALVALILTVAPPALATTFYVDPATGSPTGNGSEANPWRTLEEVFSQNKIESRNADGSVKNSGAPVKAGDTILCRSGYHGDINVSNYFNTATITVAAQEGHTPKLRRLQVSGFKNWRFSGFTISTELSPTFAKLTLVNLTGATTFVTVEKCLIYCVADVTGFSAQNWLDKTSNGIATASTCNNIQIIDNVIRNSAFAIAISGTDTLVRGNQIINYRGDGIRALNHNLTIEYNTIKNCYKVDDNHDDGIQVFLTNVSQGLIRNMVIRGNYILDHEDYTQPLASSPQGIGIFEGPHENFRIENNLVITNHWHGITLYWGRGCTIINNTVINPRYITGASNMNTWIAIEQAKSIYGGELSQNCRIANNLAHSFRTGGNINLTFENNQTVTRTNYNSIFTNFVGRDYSPKADGPAIDAGSSVDAPPLDILKNPRPTGARWDVGCYELAGPPGPPQPPIALAGADRTIYDANADGSEIVTLDGSNSYSSNGIITSWTWKLNGQTVATGATPQVTLPLGVHDITLTVTNNAEPPVSADDTTRITISSTPPATSTLLWQNFAVSLPTGQFDIEFEAQPSSAALDGVLGLSRNAADAYTDLACIFRFNSSGRMDVRNGGAYAADVVAPYTAGTWYHVRMTVNLTARTYSVYVTPQGGTQFTLATNYAFRSEQSSVTLLNNYAIIHTGTGGTVTVKDFRLPGDLLALAVSGFSVIAAHGPAGDIVTPLTENMVEGRLAGLQTLRIAFNQPLSAASLQPGALTVSGAGHGDLSNLIAALTLEPGGQTVTVSLSAPLPDIDRYTLTVTSAVQTADGRPLSAPVARQFALLAGDVDASGTVTAADVTAIRAAIATPVSADTARFDLDGSGAVTPEDLRAARSRTGHALP